MKYLKIAFIVALINYLVIGGLVLILKEKTQPEQKIIITPTIVPTALPTSAPIKKQTVGVTTVPKQIIPTIAKPTVDSRCIITIDGVKYDVSQYRFDHSGGDIFNCGSDMSSIFHNRHPNSFLRRMASYLIN